MTSTEVRGTGGAASQSALRLDRLPEEMSEQLRAAVAALPPECEPILQELITVVFMAFSSAVRHGRLPGGVDRAFALGRELAGAGADPAPALSLLRSITRWALEDASRSAHPAAVTRDVLRVGSTMTQRLLSGFHEREALAVSRSEPVLDGELLARGLLAGEGPAGAAPAYTVCAVRARADGDLDRVRAHLRTSEASGISALLGDRGGYVLVPQLPTAGVREPAEHLREVLSGPLWIAFQQARAVEVAEAGRTVADVVSLAVASRTPEGVYQLADFAVEFAALRHPPILEQLQRLIAPVVANPVLAETLVAYIEADGNRTRAANALIVHRSTLDYRLGRIEQLTGQQPTKPRCMQVLSVALTASLAVAERDELPAVDIRA